MAGPTSAPSWEAVLPYLIVGWMLLVLGVLLVRYLRIRRQGNPFPEVDAGQMLFDEKGASGHSDKNFMTSIGGASRVLWVTVTRDEVWLRPRPLLLARITGADMLDLIHRIPRNRIVSVSREPEDPRGRVVLRFTPPEGGNRRFFLCLKRAEEFIQALNPL